MTPKTASQYAEEKAAEFERLMVSSVETHDPESLLAWRNARALILRDIPVLKAAEEETRQDKIERLQRFLTLETDFHVQESAGDGRLYAFSGDADVYLDEIVDAVTGIS